jgi:lantibiotic modifying enzyme
MPLTPDDRLRLVARASLLRERLGGGFAVAPEADPGAGEARWRRWCRTVAGDEAAVMTRRLELEGWQERDLKPWLAGVRLAPDRPPPPWIETLVRLIAAAEAPDPAPSLVPPFQLPGRPVPFEAVLAPFVTWAVGRLQEQAGDDWHGLSERAGGALAHALLQQLAGLSEGCLKRALAAARPTGTAVADPTALLAGFAAAMRQDGLVPFVTTFPVLGRLIARCVEQWLETSRLFLSRLQQDRALLAATFGGDPGPVAELRPYRSDRHHGGFAVHELRFASGLILAYKPKPVTAEAAYHDLIAWVNRHEAPQPFTAATTLVRDGYGWQTWVAPAPCRSDGERQRFFQRSGGLLGLLHALGGVDFGADNVVAAGDLPVPIDLETLCHPRRPAPGAAAAPWQDSVWRTGLLPDWPPSPAHAQLGDVSFLGRRGDDLAGHGADVLAGLQAMQAWLQRWREPFCSVLAPLAAAPLRFIARPTHVYTDLLQRALQPAHLQDGADFSIVLEALAGDRSDLWPLLADEQAALADLDIPLFRHDARAMALILADGRQWPDFFPVAGLAQGLGRWASADQAAADLAAARACLQAPSA